MRLVWLALDLHVGGGQRVIAELSSRLAERGHEMLIIYPRGRGGYPVPPGVQIRQVGIAIESSLSSVIINMPAMIAAVPPCDWILTSMPLATIGGYLAALIRRARVLSYIMTDECILFDDRSSLHSYAAVELYHWTVDIAQSLPVTIAVNSVWTQNRVRRGHGGDFPIISPGVDLQIFRPEGPSLARDDLFTLVCVGRRHRLKGLPDLVDALNRMPQTGSDGKFQLWVIAQEALDFSQAKFPVKTYRPTSSGEIASILRSADLLVHPSWFEGFGLPPLEAMACGTPGVLTDCGGISEYAKEGQNCLIVPIRNPGAMAKAIAKLMEDEELLKRLALAGPHTAARFTWAAAADAMEVILKSKSRR